MSRRDGERLTDILASADAILSHLGRRGLDDGLVFDAVRVRLIEIGEAVKDISAEILATEPHILGATSPGCGTNSLIATSIPPTASSRRQSMRTCLR